MPTVARIRSPGWCKGRSPNATKRCAGPGRRNSGLCSGAADALHAAGKGGVGVFGEKAFGDCARGVAVAGLTEGNHSSHVSSIGELARRKSRGVILQQLEGPLRIAGTQGQLRIAEEANLGVDRCFGM